jgi:hypothetical protein
MTNTPEEMQARARFRAAEANYAKYVITEPLPAGPTPDASPGLVEAQAEVQATKAELERLRR